MRSTAPSGTGLDERAEAFKSAFKEVRGHPILADLDDDAAIVLCSIYWNHPLQKLTVYSGAEYLMSMMTLHENGFLKIIMDGENFKIVPVSTK